MLTKISLFNFRNYQNISLDLPKLSCFIGENGSGKTNFLEAVSLLSPGKGLRGANLVDLTNFNTNQTNESNFINYQNTSNQVNFILNFTLSSSLSDSSINKIAIKSIYDKETNSIKKAFLLDDTPLSKQSELAYYCKPIWVTPKMDLFFLEDNTYQRQFFDRLIYNFHIPHLGRLSSYNQAIKERNRLLKGQNLNNSWLTAIEEVISEKGVAIAATRLEFIEKLNLALEAYGKQFSHIKVDIDGFVENLLKDNKALTVENLFKEELKKQRYEDARTATTSIGVHKSYFNVVNLKTSSNARLCSTGQQKIILITIIMTVNYLMILEFDIKPILLLDEILVHLDNKTQDNLVNQLIELDSQCLITATEVSQNFSTKFDIFEVKDNNINTFKYNKV